MLAIAGRRGNFTFGGWITACPGIRATGGGQSRRRQSGRAVTAQRSRAECRPSLPRRIRSRTRWRCRTPMD